MGSSSSRKDLGWASKSTRTGSSHIWKRVRPGGARYPCKAPYSQRKESDQVPRGRTPNGNARRSPITYKTTGSAIDDLMCEETKFRCYPARFEALPSADQ